MPDKYDEVALEELIRDIRQGQIITEADGSSYYRHTLDPIKALIRVDDFLRSAFPSPAEDMMVLVNKIRARDFECGLDDEIISSWFKLDDKQAAAEIESFAQSRVEPWREALEAFERWWRLPNIARSVETIEPAMRKCLSLLSDSPAKENT